MRTPEKPFEDYQDRLLRLPEVEFLSGLKKTSIYRRSGGFPAPVKVSRATAWRESEVNAWIASRPTANVGTAYRARTACTTSETACA